MKYTTDRIPRAPSSTYTTHSAQHDDLSRRARRPSMSFRHTLYHMYGVDVVCARSLNVALN